MTRGIQGNNFSSKAFALTLVQFYLAFFISAVHSDCVFRKLYFSLLVERSCRVVEFFRLYLLIS